MSRFPVGQGHLVSACLSHLRQFTVSWVSHDRRYVYLLFRYVDDDDVSILSTACFDYIFHPDNTGNSSWPKVSCFRQVSKFLCTGTEIRKIVSETAEADLSRRMEKGLSKGIENERKHENGDRQRASISKVSHAASSMDRERREHWAVVVRIRTFGIHAGIR